MIRMFKLLLIYGGEESKSQAERMKRAIQRSYMPVIVTVVDNNYYGAYAVEAESERIFNAIDGSHYAIAFLTKALALQENKDNAQYTAKPNLWLEIGYLRKVVDPRFIKYLCTFPHRCLGTNEFLTASDLPTAHFFELNGKNTVSQIWKALATQLCNENILPTLPTKRESSLIFCSEYRTDYRYLFTENELKALSVSHPEKQYYILWDKWYCEHQEFSTVEYRTEIDTSVFDQWHMLYLFERIVFLTLFPASLKKDILKFLYHYVGNDPVMECCACIYNDVITYIKEHNTTQLPSFYQGLFDDIQKHQEQLDECAPIVDIIVQNYSGLLRLNEVRAYENNKMFCSEEWRHKCLDDAEKYFMYVIKRAGNTYLGDTEEVFQGFAEYNLARVLQMRDRYIEASSHYRRAIQIRKNLSEADCFPKVIKLYFLSELFHAEIDLYKLALAHPDIKVDLPKNLIKQISDTIDEMSMTVQFSVPLFQHVKDKLEKLKKAKR